MWLQVFPGARGGIDGKQLVGRRVAIENVADGEGLRLQGAGLAGVVGPGDFELLDVDLLGTGLLACCLIYILGMTRALLEMGS